jgi:hypothetical protein
LIEFPHTPHLTITLARIIEYHKGRAISYFKKQIKKLKDDFKYSEVTFHLILFPVPQKKPIIDNFVEHVKHYKKN